MNLRFLIFVTTVCSILSLCSWYLARRFIALSPWAASHRSVVWLGVVLFILMQILGPLLYRFELTQGHLRFIFLWISYTFLGIFTCLFFYSVVTDLPLSLWKWFSKGPMPDLERRSFLGVVALSFTSVVIGVVQVIRGPKIYEIEIPFPHLPAELDGFTLAQISDLHIGPTITKTYAEKVAQMTNALGADAIVLTGDFVDGSVEQLKDDMEPIFQLKAPHGVYFITGNHEYYSGAEEWIAEWKRAGIHVLENEHRIITKNGKSLVMAGVHDVAASKVLPTHVSSPARAAQGAPQDLVKILLAHQPKSYLEAHQAGFDLQLSGHTHGGQFFPFSILVGFAHRFVAGLGRHEKMWVYVNRGTGYWGPPIRFLVHGEITKIRLRRANA